MISMATPNALFAVMDVSDEAAIEARMAHIAPWLSLKVGHAQWLLVAPVSTTTKEVSDRLGITGEPAVSTGIVARVENYYGRNSPSIWEWVSTKQGAELAATASV
jgi:hypothetical protein